MFELIHRNNNHSMNSYNPFREMEELERSFFGQPFGSFFGSADLAEFKTDVIDQGDAYILEADLPGFKKEDIKLNLSGDTLTVQAERKSHDEQKDKKGTVIRMERSYGSYSRSFDVSEIDTDKIKAAYDNGVLTLTLPKASTVLPESRTLEIE